MAIKFIIDRLYQLSIRQEKTTENDNDQREVKYSIEYSQ